MNRRPTPETDDLARGNHVVPTEFAQGLERERDEARSDLKFRRGLFQLQEEQLNAVRVERDEAREQVKDLANENENLYRRIESLREQYRLSSVCRKLKVENEQIQEHLDVAMMLIKLQKRTEELKQQ